MSDASLNLLYVHGSQIGYGRYGVELAKAVAAQGVTIYDHLPDPDTIGQKTPTHLQGDTSDIANVVCWIAPPSHARGWWDGQIPVISSMFESTYLPESFRESLHEFDTVIVPSEQNLELFGAYHNNVRYVPLGVDPVAWKYQPRSQPGTFFKFLIGGSGSRKGVDLAYEAFQKVFPDGSWGDGPIPMLVMKSPNGIGGLVDRAGQPITQLADRVQVIGGRLSPEDEIALYADCHAYLQPSRGEGFGLQPLQAMAQGMPTILTDAHGHASFAKLSGLGLDSTLTKSAYFIYGDAGDWWEPDFDQLCDRMRWVYDNYDAAQVQANVASWHVHERYTWAKCADGFLDAIGRDRLAAPYKGPRTWHKLEARLYKTVTRIDYQCEVAGVTRLFRAGQDYWEPADVKRILFEAGLLDMSCCTWDRTIDGIDVIDQVGLLPEQVARLGLYEARNSYCPSCSQRLNTRPTHWQDALDATEPGERPALTVVR